MGSSAFNQGITRNTAHQVVLPFYIYGALSFLAATLLLFFSSTAFVQHYFHPHTLAVTHIMALGWGTMMILGASHQLVPVLIERKLFSESAGYICFVMAGLGIPLLVYAFYFFRFGWEAQTGGLLIIGAILTYLVNISISMAKSGKENIHAVFVFTGTLWLLLTTVAGLFLVFNFTRNILAFDSLHYLSLHAHMGIVGWFLLLVFGVGSRLIPMFLISKYNNLPLLWWIYVLVNTALVFYVVTFILGENIYLNFLPVFLCSTAVFLFGYFCFKCYEERLRKKVDEPVRLSFLSILFMVLPLIFLILNIIWLLIYTQSNPLVITYGFCIFFGWMTAIILGMTFKTLPFILWNKRYHDRAGKEKTPNPKDLFSNSVFKWMTAFYLAGFLTFITGALLVSVAVLKAAAFLLIIAAVLYNKNVFNMVFHKAK